MKYWITLAVLSLIVITTGCSGRSVLQIKTNEPGITSSTSTPQVTQTIPATNTTQPTSSVTLKPTASPTPTMTWTPTPTATLTPPVTLEPDLAKEEVKRLFKEEVDCAIACFWGIVPGETSLGEVTNILKRLGISWQSTYDKGDMEVYTTRVGAIDSARGTLDLYTDNGLVENILFGFSIWKGGDKVIPHSEWLAYSPETVLKRYGKPSNVEFRVDYPHEPGAPPGSVWYDILIYFDDLELIIEYAEAPSKDGKFIQACPLKDPFFSGIGIWIGNDPSNPPSPAILLEDATGLTIDEFYELMVNGNPNTCIDLIAEAFNVNP